MNHWVHSTPKPPYPLLSIFLLESRRHEGRMDGYGPTARGALDAPGPTCEFLRWKIFEKHHAHSTTQIRHFLEAKFRHIKHRPTAERIRRLQNTIEIFQGKNDLIAILFVFFLKQKTECNGIISTPGGPGSAEEFPKRLAAGSRGPSWGWKEGWKVPERKLLRRRF